MESSHRPEIEHRVERRNLEATDMRHDEEITDMADRRLLPAFRIFGDFLLRPGKIVLVEGEILRLHFRRSKATNAHRSTSPNTMSIEPRMADTSASMCPRQRKSMACRCANPGARILHLYGLLVPSATK